MNDTEISATVVLPTYNESQNIPVIVPKIHEVLSKAGISHEILVVDDDSPDKTWEVAGNLASTYSVRVIRRQLDRGLATAVMQGFEDAYGKVCVVMDADLSHPVEKLPDMINPILAADCDLTVGSRYIPGGDCADWAWHRKLLSWGGGALALALAPMTDPTSGFMGVRKSILSGVKLEPVGWKIVLEVVVKTKGRLKEVPITFSDRLYGESKLTAGVQFQYLEHLWMLYNHRFPSFLEFVKFCLVGVSGLVVDTFVLTLLVELFGLDPRGAASIAFIAAVSWNYVLDRGWVFGADGNYSFQNYARFVGVCISGFVVRLIIMHLLIEQAGTFYIFASLIGILVSTVVNFLGSKLIVFQKK